MDTRFGKMITGKAFPIVFMFIFIFMLVFCASVTDSALRAALGIRTLYGLPYIIFALTAVLIMTQSGHRFPGAPRSFKMFVGFITCFVIYDFIILLAWKLIAALLRLKKLVTAAGALISTGLAVLTVALGYLHTKTIKTVEYDIPVLKSRYTIALISDIHLGIFVGAEHAQKIVDRVNALNPDLILISGDIIDVDNEILSEHAKLDRIAAVFKGFRARDGVYAVLGNHDPDISAGPMLDFMAKSDIHLLHNETVRVAGFNLMGRTDDAHNERLPMDVMMEDVDEGRPLIVLDHDPQGIKEAEKYGADLVLSGHTHKGQFFPATLFTKWANGKHYFYGYEDFGKTKAVITSGAGFFQLPVRIGSSNEVAKLVLT